MIAKAKPGSFEDVPLPGEEDKVVKDTNQGIEEELEVMLPEEIEYMDDPLKHCSTDEHPELLPPQYDEPPNPMPLDWPGGMDDCELMEEEEMLDLPEYPEYPGELVSEVASEFIEELAKEEGDDGLSGRRQEKGEVEEVYDTSHKLTPAVICPLCNVAGEEKGQKFFCPKCGKLLQGCCD